MEKKMLQKITKSKNLIGKSLNSKSTTQQVIFCLAKIVLRTLFTTSYKFILQKPKLASIKKLIETIHYNENESAYEFLTIKKCKRFTSKNVCPKKKFKNQ